MVCKGDSQSLLVEAGSDMGWRGKGTGTKATCALWGQDGGGHTLFYKMFLVQGRACIRPSASGWLPRETRKKKASFRNRSVS